MLGSACKHNRSLAVNLGRRWVPTNRQRGQRFPEKADDFFHDGGEVAVGNECTKAKIQSGGK